MQIYADVTDREFRIVERLAGALGAAMHGAVAAGAEAAAMPTSMPPPPRWAASRMMSSAQFPRHVTVYDQLYADYSTLYDYFGRGENDVMKRLRHLRRAALT